MHNFMTQSWQAEAQNTPKYGPGPVLRFLEKCHWLRINLLPAVADPWPYTSRQFQIQQSLNLSLAYHGMGNSRAFGFRTGELDESTLSMFVLGIIILRPYTDQMRHCGASPQGCTEGGVSGVLFVTAMKQSENKVWSLSITDFHSLYLPSGLLDHHCSLSPSPLSLVFFRKPPATANFIFSIIKQREMSSPFPSNFVLCLCSLVAGLYSSD